MQIKLEDINPQTGEFSLASTGSMVHRLRPISLSDQAWLIQKFGGPEGISRVFSTLDIDGICVIAFRLLEEKEPFEAGDVDEYDDDGIKKTVFVSGPEKLKRAICGPNETIALIQALSKTIGASQPNQEDVATGKKKTAQGKRRATRR